MKQISCKTKIQSSISRVHKDGVCITERNKTSLLTKRVRFWDFGYKNIITSDYKFKERDSNNIVYIEDSHLDKFHQNDIISINYDGISFLWEFNSSDNCFFITESCSCKCVMCPQPPNKHNPILEKIADDVLSLIPKTYRGDICITGGEPTIIKEYFLSLIMRIREKFPYNFLMVLTNGKSFANYDFLNDFSKIRTKSILAVSMHSDIDYIHDKIVGASKSFDKTQKGIYNLAKAQENIEIRFVISKLNYKRLPNFAEFIYRNFPFIRHVALMGMEYKGLASDNYEDISINPIEYKKYLYEAVRKLDNYNMSFSIYNVPLCLLDERIRKNAAKSISKWKQEYVEECDGCLLKDKCCGVFKTSGEHVYKNISPIINS